MAIHSIGSNRTSLRGLAQFLAVAMFSLLVGQPVAHSGQISHRKIAYWSTTTGGGWQTTYLRADETFLIYHKSNGERGQCTLTKTGYLQAHIWDKNTDMRHIYGGQVYEAGERSDAISIGQGVRQAVLCQLLN